MNRLALLALLTFSVASFSPPQEPAPKDPDQPKSAVRLHVIDMTIDDSWFEDRYRHALGQDVAVFVSGNETDGIAVDFGAKKAAHTAGCAVTVRLRRNGEGVETAEVSGTWWIDLIRNGEPSRGPLTDVVGDVFISKHLGSRGGLVLKFAIRATANERDVTLMGGSHIVVPDKK